MLAIRLTLSMLEISLFLSAAMVLGITIHFYIISLRSSKTPSRKMKKIKKAEEEWKLKYLNDIELRFQEITNLKQQINEAKENANIFSIEVEELRQQHKQFRAARERLEKKLSDMDKRTNLRRMIMGEEIGALMKG